MSSTRALTGSERVTAFRYGYCVELGWDEAGAAAVPVGLSNSISPVTRSGLVSGPGSAALRADLRAGGGRASDDEGWVLTVVDDPDRCASDLYVLDASALGRRRPEAIIHLPERLPFRSHGEWVPADRYR